MSDEIDAEILENAQGPRSAEGDGQRVDQHSLPNQIAAAKYLAGKQSRLDPSASVMRFKIVPPGTA